MDRPRHNEADPLVPTRKNPIAEYSCGGWIPETWLRDYVDVLLERADEYADGAPHRVTLLDEVRVIGRLFRIWRELYGPTAGGSPQFETMPRPRVPRPRRDKASM